MRKRSRTRTCRIVASSWPVASSDQPPEPSGRIDARASIQIHGAREHNLKNIDVELPRNQFTVVTGVSGSGKSTLAFDIVFGEGQRRYLESLNAYARQFVQPASRPDVDAIFGIPPTVAIEQRTSRGGRKSTVATLTEIYHFLRLLYVKLGTQYCPDCDVAIEPQSFESIVARMLREYRGQTISLFAPLVVARKGYYTDLAAWAAKKGYTHLRVDGELLPTNPWPRLSRFKEHTIEAPIATLQRFSEDRARIACGADHRAGFRERAWCTSPKTSGYGLRATGYGPEKNRRRSVCLRPPAPSLQPRDFLHPPRLSLLRTQLRGARSASVLVQFEARLVREVLSARVLRSAASMRSRAARKSGGTSGSRKRRRSARAAMGSV